MLPTAEMLTFLLYKNLLLYKNQISDMLGMNLGSLRSCIGVIVGVPTFFDVLILECRGARFYMGTNSALCVFYVLLCFQAVKMPCKIRGFASNFLRFQVLPTCGQQTMGLT